MKNRQHGKIKFFKQSGGFGFIEPDDGSGDVFLHVNTCQECGIEPEQGMAVQFEAAQGAKGRKAIWVGR